MGAAHGIEPKPSKESFDVMTKGPSGGSSLETHWISSSFLYCLAQHVAEWPDYYIIVDLRSCSSFDKSHVAGSIHVSNVEDSLPEHMQGMIVAIVDSKPPSPLLNGFLRRIERESVAPAAIYILSEKFSEFRSKYNFILSDFKPTRGQLPGPVEYIPKTKARPAVFSLQRDRYPHCKTLVAYLGCTVVINLSSTRLSVASPNITLENVPFDADNEPYEKAVAVVFSHARSQSKAWGNNILIIDEPGCNFSALLTGWFLVEGCGQEVEAVCQHMTNKSADLDPWYMNTLRHWDRSRRRNSERR